MTTLLLVGLQENIRRQPIPVQVIPELGAGPGHGRARHPRQQRRRGLVQVAAGGAGPGRGAQRGPSPEAGGCHQSRRPQVILICFEAQCNKFLRR